jgi:GTP-binding protein HflX
VTALERLYRRRVPASLLITPELASTACQLTQDIQRPIGLLITRRGAIEQVLVGTGCVPAFQSLAKFRAGARSLRGVRLVRTHPGDEPLSQEDLTNLALLRLDAMAAIGVADDGEPEHVYLAHLVPPNPQGQVCTVVKPVLFQNLQLEFNVFVGDLESDLQRADLGHTVETGRESALLVSASPRSRGEQEEHLQELAELAESADVTIVDKIVQRTQNEYHRFLLGKGKLKEVVIRGLQRGADVLIFDQDLAPAQARAISEVTDMKVIDRTQLILDIFARRAHTREGKVQVELAQLRYLLPRLSGHGTSLSRLGGGIGSRGPGETKLETDRRRIRERITHLEHDLLHFARHQDQRRARRVRHAVPVLSIVGYTNAGKSTLLNQLTRSQVPAEDRLFETLDTTSRRLRFPHDREIIVTDTVGFIRNLPKDLLGAFRTTLEELKDADMLLHLVDASAQDIDGQIAAVESVLKALDLESIPRIVVLNKCDRLPAHEAALLSERYQALGISAVQPDTLRPLIAKIESLLISLPPPPAGDDVHTGLRRPALASHS